MNRIFWRHADANPFATTDLMRELSDLGKLQAQAAANAMGEKVKDFLVVSSDALRAQQTAEFIKKPDLILPELYADNSWESILQVIEEIQDENVVFVGHMPWVGIITGAFLDQPPMPFGKANWVWLSSKKGSQEWKIKDRYTG